jgi:phospholipase D1/2
MLPDSMACPLLGKGKTLIRPIVNTRSSHPPVPFDDLIDRIAPEHVIEQVAPVDPDRKTGPAWGKLAVIALVVLALALLWRYTPLAQIITPERVIDWARSVGTIWWAPLLVIAAYSPACFVMFPRPLITLFAVIAFGPWLGFVTAISGIVGAALATYYAGRILPASTLRHLAGDKVDRVSAVLRRRGLIAVFAMRIIPVAPFFIEGMIAGAVRIKLWHYVFGTILGMTPGTLTTTVFGDLFATALEDPSRINYWLVAGVAVFFVVLIYFVRRWFAKEYRLSRRSVPAA